LRDNEITIRLSFVHSHRTFVHYCNLELGWENSTKSRLVSSRIPLAHSSCFVNCNSSDCFFLDYIQRNEWYSKLQTSRAGISFHAHFAAMLQLRRRQRLPNVAVIVIVVGLRAYRIRHRKTMGESTCVSSKISATAWDERREKIERERREGGEETTFPRFFGFVSKRISLFFSLSSPRSSPVSPTFCHSLIIGRLGERDARLCIRYISLIYVRI